MTQQENSNEELKKLLSFRGIFHLYNFREIVKFSPFWISLITLVFYILYSIIFPVWQKDISVFLIEKVDTLYPSLLGFSLGGYAIIISFGNTDFLKKIAKSGSLFYGKLNAIFAFSILLQVVVLLLSLMATFIQKLTNDMVVWSDRVYQVTNCIFNSVLIFFTIWSISLIPYVVSNIFIFGQSHHELLKKED